MPKLTLQPIFDPAEVSFLARDMNIVPRILRRDGEPEIPVSWCEWSPAFQGTWADPEPDFRRTGQLILSCWVWCNEHTWRKNIVILQIKINFFYPSGSPFQWHCRICLTPFNRGVIPLPGRGIVGKNWSARSKTTARSLICKIINNLKLTLNYLANYTFCFPFKLLSESLFSVNL